MEVRFDQRYIEAMASDPKLFRIGRFVLDGGSISEIAERLDMTEGDVETAWLWAKNWLLEKLSVQKGREASEDDLYEDMVTTLSLLLDAESTAHYQDQFPVSDRRPPAAAGAKSNDAESEQREEAG